jgi:fructose-specific component phosphotransferase system IIB-like protein
MSGPAQDDSGITVGEDSPRIIDPIELLANDPAGTSILAVGDAVGGTVGINQSGDIVFTPDADYNGPASFTYTADDGNGGTSTATVDLTVMALNDAPVAVDDTGLTVAEDELLFIAAGDLLGNDTDIDGDTLHIQSVQDAVGGIALLDQNGNVTFSPYGNYHGPASFTYTTNDGVGGTSTATVTLTVTPTNDAPIPVNDSGFTTAEDTALVIAAGALFGNDSDIDGDTLQIQSVQGAVSGTVALDQNGNVTFTPAADYNGPASFTYTVSDGNGGTTTATVDLTVTPVNDAPVAVDNAFSITEDSTLFISRSVLLGNDTDADSVNPGYTGLQIQSVQDAVGGTATLDQNGNVTFAATASYNGNASFTYTVTDAAGLTSTATVSIAIAPSNDSPEGVDDAGFTTGEDTPLVIAAADILANDLDPDNDTLFIDSVYDQAGGTVALDQDGNVVFTPWVNYHGPASFTYLVSDAEGGMGFATVNLTVTPINDAVDATDDSGFSTSEDTALLISGSTLRSNDIDPDYDVLQIASVQDAIGGTVSLNQAGNVIFTPTANYNGAASFTYTVSDGSSSDTATVSLTVNAVNDKPVATNDAFDIASNTPFAVTTAQLMANDSDIDSNTLSISTVAGAKNGTVSLVNGTVTFTPTANFTGNASFQYVLRDGNGGFALGVANLTVANALTGDAGDNTLTGSSGLDVITGAGGDDLMSGGNGSDTYVIARGDGIDTVVQAGIADAGASTDVLEFSSGVAHDQLWFRQVGDDLRIDVIGETASSVLLEDWYTDVASRLDRIDAVDGSYSLSAANVENLVSAMAAFSPPAPGQMTLAAAGLNDDLAGTLAANWQAA